jgi:hypothetical protein
MKQIIVKINRSERRDKYFEGYQEGDPLEAALSIEVFNAGLASPDDPDDVLLEKIFHALNVDDYQGGYGNLTGRDVKEYHQKYPSLSVGDVVEINGQPYACQRLGWQKLERDHDSWVWVDAADVAKIIRSILKEHFGQTKFSVRTRKYAGGASIDVGWWDGPTEDEVNYRIKHLQAVSHMDISDYVHRKNTVHDGKVFHSGASHIFCKRKHSRAFLTECAKEVIAEWGIEYDIPTFNEYHSFGAYPSEGEGLNERIGGSNWSFSELIRKEAHGTNAYHVKFTDEPETFEWTDREGNRVHSTYHRGKVKSKWDGGKRTESVDYADWTEFKARKGAEVLANA